MRFAQVFGLDHLVAIRRQVLGQEAASRPVVLEDQDRGDLRLHDVAAGASVAVGTGDVRVELAPSWNGPRLFARCKVGDVRITAASGLRARVDAHTRLGDVHNALAAASAGAAAPLIDARTNVGDVSIFTR